MRISIDPYSYLRITISAWPTQAANEVTLTINSQDYPMPATDARALAYALAACADESEKGKQRHA